MKIVDSGAPESRATRPTTPDPVHQTALTALPTKDARVLYACAVLGQAGADVYPRDVIEWLAPYGVEAKRQRTSKILNAWKRGDTRPLPTEATGDIEDDTADLPELDEATQAGLEAIRYPSDFPPPVSPGDTDGHGATPPGGDTLTRATPAPTPSPDRPPSVWPLYLLALPAMVAIWGGWVTLGSMTGFDAVHPLPGIWDQATVNSSIMLPFGVEVYAGYALHAWLSHRVVNTARTFARWSAIGSVLLGMAGQITVHLLTAARMAIAPWGVTAVVSCIPGLILLLGVALAVLIRREHRREHRREQATGRE